MLGSEDIVCKNIKNDVMELLSRRGFVITDSNPEYQMLVLYNIEPRTKQSSFQSIQDKSLAVTSNNSVGLGVLFASELNSSLYSSQSVNTSSIQIDLFVHSFAMEIRDKTNKMIWKNDTEAVSLNRNIFSLHKSVIQYAVSSLPTNGKVIPRVERLKNDRIIDYLSLNDYSYRCPALPHIIRFPQFYNVTYSQNQITTLFPKKDTSAIHGFIDLLQTAEYAIPKGSLIDWKNPTTLSIWTSPTLIGRYYIGNEKTPSNLVIQLRATPNNYQVLKCIVVNDEAYAKYQALYSAWENRLKEFYSFNE